MSILAKSPDLTKIIKKAVERIGENHSLSRDNTGVTMMATEIEKDRKEFRNTKVIEESLKAAADEMAEKLVLENTIDGMIKDVIEEQQLPELPEGCEDCLRGAIGEKYEDKADSIILAVSQFIISGEMPTLNDLLELLEGVNAMDALVIGPKLLECANTCGVTMGKDATRYIDDEGKIVAIPRKKLASESTTDIIKKLVNKKLKNKLNEAKKTHPGYDAYEKAVKKSKTENNNAMKDTEKKFKEYGDFKGNTHPEYPHQEDSKTDPDNIGYQYYRNNDEDQEFIDDFAYPGLQDFDIHNLNMERLTDYLEGSSETGNAQEDEDGQALGNVGKSELGNKIKKSAERRKEKIAANKASMSNLRGYTPDVQKVKQVKEEVTGDMENMKKLWSYNKKTQ